MAAPRPRERASLSDRQVRATLVFLTLIFLVVALAPTIGLYQIRSASDALVNETDRLAIAVQAINSDMIDLETGERGYVITGNEAFLEPYNRGQVDLARQWPVAKGLALQVGGQAPDLLDRMNRSATTWQAQSGAVEVALVQNGQRTGAADLVAAGQGKLLFDQYRQDFGQIQSYIRQTRRGQSQRRDLLLDRFNLLLIGLAVAGLAGLLLLYKIGNVSRGYLIEAVRTRELNRARDEFIAVASHELKTPMTTIKGQVQFLLRQVRRARASHPDQTAPLNLERVSEQLTAVERQTNRAVRLIDVLLDVTRIRTNRLRLHLTNADLVLLVSTAAARLGPAITTHALRLENDLAHLPVRVDEVRIEQVLANLVNNAAKYSAGSPVITIALRRTGYDAICSVVDTGIGIPTADRERIFDQFARAQNVNSGNISGLGVGLFLSAEIIKLHNGRIWVESEEGKGSTFSFSLPLAP